MFIHFLKDFDDEKVTFIICGSCRWCDERLCAERTAVRHAAAWRRHDRLMMLSQPDAKLTTVSMESGFANETSFFRVFKAITGLTPKEWLASQ